MKTITIKQPVYAVIRLDEPFRDGAILDSIAITSILPSYEEAEDEVTRLNLLNSQNGASYAVISTRYFPNGRDNKT